MSALAKLKRILKEYIYQGLYPMSPQSVRLALEDVSSDERVPAILSQTDSKGRTSMWLSAAKRDMKTFYVFIDILTAEQLTTVLTIKGHDIIHRLVVTDDTKTIEDIFLQLTQDQLFKVLTTEDNESNNPVGCGAYSDMFLTLRFLLKSVNPDRRCDLLKFQNSSGKTALHRAFFRASWESIKAILNSVTQEEQHVLHMIHAREYEYPLAEIALEGHFEVCEMFLKEYNYLRDMNADDRAILFEGAICRATYNMYTETHDLLIPLMDSKELRQLIRNLTTIEQRYSIAITKEEKGENYISPKALKNLSEILKTVMDNVSAEKRFELLTAGDGETAVSTAARLGCVAAVKSLLGSLTTDEVCQILLMGDSEGDNTLSIAAFNCRTVMVQYLLDTLNSNNICYDAVRMQNRRGRTVLHREAWKGHSVIFRDIVNSLPHEKVSEVLLLADNNGDTAFSDAAYRGCSTIATYILYAFPMEGRHQLLAIQNVKGQTSLHIAIQNNHREVLVTILKMVDSAPDMDRVLETKDVEGRTAMDVAALTGNIESFECLRHKSTRICAEGEDRRFSADAFVERIRTLPDKQVEHVTPGIKKRAHSKSSSQGDLEESIGKKSKIEQTKQLDMLGDKAETAVDEEEAGEGDEAADKEEEAQGEVAYTALPAELVHSLETLCKSAEVKDSLFIREPSDWNTIVIVGTNATNISDVALGKVVERFPDYTISTEEDGNPMATNLLTWNSVKLEQLEFKSRGTCELIVQRGDADGADNSTDTAYAVGVAHVLYSNEENDQLQNGSMALDTARQLLRERPTSVYQAEGDPWNRRWVRSAHPPLLSYRYFCPRTRHDTANILTRENNVEQQSCATDGTPTSNGVNIDLCMNDMLLLPLVREEAEFLHRQLNSYRLSRRPTLVCINTMDRIREYNAPLRRKPIAVNEFSGFVVPNPVDVDEQARKCIGYHIVFQLTNGELQPGDSGSIVYLEEKEKGVIIHKPLAMLVGNVMIRQKLYYRAVILNLALKDMEVSCNVNNLKLLRLEHER